VRARWVAAGLLVLAALFDLPVVYRVAAEDRLPPPVALGFGFLAMGLAWGAGFQIEGRRRWFVLLAGVVGALQVAAPLAGVPGWPWAAASGAASVGALVVALRD
jgi:hypothetical protein